MGYMTVMSECFGCGQVFEYNPELVPSVRPPRWIPVNVLGLASAFSIPSETREPVCQNCVNVANPRRIANGLEPIQVLPGAYEGAEI